MGNISEGGDMKYIVEKTQIFEVDANNEEAALLATKKTGSVNDNEPVVTQVIISTTREANE